MPNQSRIAERHRRTRRDHESETAEDYVEAVAAISEDLGRCRVVDLARRFAVSHVTVTRTIARLSEAGLMTSERYGPVELTAKGRRLAALSKRRHHVVYEFLKAIGVSPSVAAIDAEGIEHHVSRVTLRRFQAVTEMLARDGRITS